MKTHIDRRQGHVCGVECLPDSGLLVNQARPRHAASFYLAKNFQLDQFTICNTEKWDWYAMSRGACSLSMLFSSAAVMHNVFWGLYETGQVCRTLDMDDID